MAYGVDNETQRALPLILKYAGMQRDDEIGAIMSAAGEELAVLRGAMRELRKRADSLAEQLENEEAEQPESETLKQFVSMVSNKAGMSLLDAERGV
jgi:acyl-[acyl carrier protein]--UDP-N-acetylglucosamine O-acyltransferase